MPNNDRNLRPPLPQDPADALESVRMAAWAGAGLASLILAAAAPLAPAMQPADISVTGSTGASLVEPVKDTASGYAIAFGESRSLEALRARWADLSGRHSAQLGALTPLVLTRQAANGPAFMLLAGPVANAVGAANTCRTLRASAIACEATLFAGEPLR
jgi:hypothetical protein